MERERTIERMINRNLYKRLERLESRSGDAILPRFVVVNSLAPGGATCVRGGALGESTFRYVFAQPNDAAREIIIPVLAFDIPRAPADQKTII